MSLRTRWRKIVNVVMLSLTGLCALLTVSALFFILGYLLWYGGKSLNWAFFTKLPVPVGETGGGMANAIVGSGKLLLLASLVGIPIGLLAGVYLAEFGGTTFSFIVRYTADLLNGVPSIVMGIFAYTIIVIPMKHFSAFAGGLALGVMMIPIAVRTTEESARRAEPFAGRRVGFGGEQVEDRRDCGCPGSYPRNRNRPYANAGAGGRGDGSLVVHCLR